MDAGAGQQRLQARGRVATLEDLIQAVEQAEVTPLWAAPMLKCRSISGWRSLPRMSSLRSVSYSGSMRSRGGCAPSRARESTTRL